MSLHRMTLSGRNTSQARLIAISLSQTINNGRKSMGPLTALVTVAVQRHDHGSKQDVYFCNYRIQKKNFCEAKDSFT